MRKRPDRAAILDEWILATIEVPAAEEIRTTGGSVGGGGFMRWTTGLYGLSSLPTERLFTTRSSIEGSQTMRAKYFKDTDTLYLELRDSEVVETRDLDQDTILDYDGQGKVVGITIEHAKTRIGGPRIELETVEA